MIRQPTPDDVAYAWWREAVATGRVTEIHEGHPQPGYYKRKVRIGPHRYWRAVEIYVDRVTDPETGELTEPERIVAWADGTAQDPASMWTYLQPISEAEFRRLVNDPPGPLDEADPARLGPVRPPKRNQGETHV